MIRVGVLERQRKRRIAKSARKAEQNLEESRRQKAMEDMEEFRRKSREVLEKSHIQTIQIPADYHKAVIIERHEPVGPIKIPDRKTLLGRL